MHILDSVLNIESIVLEDLLFESDLDSLLIIPYESHKTQD